MFCHGPRCCNLSWLPLMLWRDISLEIFQIQGWEFVTTWISWLCQTWAFKIITAHLFPRSGLSCSLWTKTPTSWWIHSRWGAGVLLLKGRTFGQGWGSTDIILPEVIPEGIPEGKKKSIYLNEKGYKIFSSCWTFVRVIKFLLLSTPPLVWA